MILRRGDATIEHRVFRDIVDLLQPGDLLVCNESRVIPARLYGRRAETGGRVEVLLIAPRANNVWEALVKPGRRLRPGARIEFTRPDKPTGTPPFVPADPAPAAEHTDVVADVSRICHTAAVRRTLRCPPQVDSESASGPSRFTVRRTPDSFGGLRRSEDSFGEPHNRANAARRGRGGADASSAPPISLVGEIVDRAESGGRLIAFDGVENLEAALEELGAVPLPPYVHAPLSDAERYQTVFARIKGSVAAPTAGLHFTRDLMKIARDRGVTFAFVTLHIGLDTFRPVQVEDVAEHKMHTEFCELSPDVADEINTARAQGRRVVAVGTTSVRVLESAGRLAAEDPSLASHHTAVVKPFRGWTDIFIYPGHRFKAVDALITNFHLPRSTLLMLVSAFAGKDLIHRAYAEAIDRDYRFYSFGDCMLIL